MKLRFRWTSERDPGSRWLALYERSWPAYRAWFLREGDLARPSLAEGRAKLLQHMPELVPLWERLTELAGGGTEVARMLSLYRPTPYLSGCTQAVWPGPPPILVRNYDYHPNACEATFTHTKWMGTRVLGASDCLWGLLDGVNEHGLTVALSFGGSRRVADGFGIPLILRYVLESCASVGEAVKVLLRVPSHMAYNVSVLDRTGSYEVVGMRPGGGAQVMHERVATNHQSPLEWPEYAVRTHSAERMRFLEAALPQVVGADELVKTFLAPPLFVTDYEGWHGTLYTAVYGPRECSVQVHWPGASVQQTIDDFREREFDVPLVG